MHLWKEVETLKNLAPFLVVPRDDKTEKFDKTNSNLFSIPNISSSNIRKIIKQKGTAHNLVDKKVDEYIKKHSLYL